MLLLSVVAIGAMAAIVFMVDPASPAQTAQANVADNFALGLSNGDGQTMHVQ